MHEPEPERSVAGKVKLKMGKEKKWDGMLGVLTKR